MLEFADRTNFHAKNFPALFRAILAQSISTHYYDWGDNGLKQAHGDYRSKRSILERYCAPLKNLPPSKLLDYKHRSVNLFSACRYELLHHLMLEPNWYDVVVRNEPKTIIEKASSENRDALLLNMAAAAFWIDYWNRHLCQVKVFPHVVCIFGNSLSYTRALTLQAERLKVVPIVFEHFFTGQDHFMEPRLDAIQGYSELRLGAVRAVAPDPALVLQKLTSMQNRNVTQAPFRRTYRARGKGKTILILGQVVNDFAAVSRANQCLGSIATYKKLIHMLLSQTDAQLIFKAHPYERLKTFGRGSITYQELRAFVARRHPDEARRATIVEDYPLESLFLDADLCITLHSQSALEALAREVPVATLGNPFYGHQGFTHDFDDVESLVSAVKNNALTVFSSEQRDKYFSFMTRCFQVLVNQDDPADRVLERLVSFGMALDIEPQQLSTGLQRAALKVRSRLVVPFVRKTRKLGRDPRRFFLDAMHNLADKFGSGRPL